VHGAAAPDKRWPVVFSAQAAVNLDYLHLKWYDHWLKEVDNGIDRQAPIQIFVMGANQWRSEEEWPLPGTRWTEFYLVSGGKANGSRGDGALASVAPRKDGGETDEYLYDPRNPVSTLGGQIAIFPEIWGAQDRRSVEEREDVLVYSTDPLSQDLEVTGPVEAIIYAASSAEDTDFTATLSDVYPDGKTIHLCEGIRGARFRTSLEHPSTIRPGTTYEYRISLWETSNVFLAGHRIRLEISSSNFPRFARNQNTAKPFGMSSEMNVAKQRLFHDARYPSRLVLPVIARR
jgi:putative CocE/NonD family hydrolase